MLAAQGLILSEIMVDPTCNLDDCEFVELKNQSTATIDIGSWKVTDGESGINEWTATFPAGTMLSPWEFVIVAKDESAFIAEYPGAACTVFQITNTGSGAGLANTGDNVNLLNPSGGLVQTYSWGGTVDRAVYNGSTWTTSSGGTDGDPCNSAVLPIMLASFEARYDQFVFLQWRTATEISNDYFAIERSAAGSLFSEISRVRGAGNSFEPQRYTFTDEAPWAGLNYYRLRQVDFDGQSAYSATVTVVAAKPGEVRLFPSPATDFLKIQLEKPLNENAVWELSDLAGRQLMSGVFFAENTDFEINTGELPEGVHILRLVANGVVTGQLFLKSN